MLHVIKITPFVAFLVCATPVSVLGRAKPGSDCWGYHRMYQSSLPHVAMSTQLHAMSDAAKITVKTSTFHDDGEYATLELDVSSVGGGVLDVQSTGDSIAVVLHRAGTTKPVVIWSTPLVGTIDASATCWSTSETKQMTIRLKKLDPSAAWPHLARASQESAAEEQDDHAPPENPLEQREHVKALLTAAQTGDLEGLGAAAASFSAGDLSSVRDGNGRNALHFAAAGGHADLCHGLLHDWGFDADACDEAGKSDGNLWVLQFHCMQAWPSRLGDVRRRDGSVAGGRFRPFERHARALGGWCKRIHVAGRCPAADTPRCLVRCSTRASPFA